MNEKKINNDSLFVMAVIFFILNFTFVFFSGEISSFISTALNLKKSEITKTVIKKKKKEKIEIEISPVNSQYPKTKPVFISKMKNIFTDKKGKLAPNLREYTGQTWSKEKTEIHFSTDGYKMRIDIFCEDKNIKELPPASITNTKTDTNDCIQLLFFKSLQEKNYYYLTIDYKGNYVWYRCGNYKNPARIPKPRLLKNFISRIKFSTENNGYRIKIILPITKFNLGKLNKNSTVFFQIVRRYRADSKSERKILQLFPSHIYASNKGLEISQDRRTFQPLKVK